MKLTTEQQEEITKLGKYLNKLKQATTEASRDNAYGDNSESHSLKSVKKPEKKFGKEKNTF